MISEFCNGNFNHMYEWELEGKWYPCHIYTPNLDENDITIFTRNGSIMRVQPNRVRKMCQNDYISNREECIKNLGKHAYDRGFHEDMEEDIRLFEESNELNS